MKRLRVARVGVLLTLMLALSGLASAEVRLPALIGDNMVLQQGMDARLWGWADAGEPVTVSGSWEGGAASTVTDSDGTWMVTLETPEAGGPYTVSIQGENSIELTNVMVGEVWVCSGQSNMQMSLAPAAPWHKGVLNFEQEIAGADHPRLRLFSVGLNIAREPQDDCTGEWSVCSPETVAGFTIAGKDRKFVEADAVIDGDAVVVSAPGVTDPVAVRFGWTSTATPNLFNKEGLPASPFRTDDWPGVTQVAD